MDDEVSSLSLGPIHSNVDTFIPLLVKKLTGKLSAC